MYTVPFIVGLIGGVVTAVALHLNYNLLSHRKTLQFALLLATVFFGLLPGTIFGLYALAHGQHDTFASTAYSYGWLMTTFFGFAFWVMIGRARR
jgi:hypothetical protein